MAKKAKSRKVVSATKVTESQRGGITIQALKEMSDSDDDDAEEWLPESKWNSDALELKKTIESGAFDKLLNRKAESEMDDHEPFEEAELDEDDDDDDVDDDDDENGDNNASVVQSEVLYDDDENDDDDDANSDDEDENDEDDEEENSDDDDENNNGDSEEKTRAEQRMSKPRNDEDDNVADASKVNEMASNNVGSDESGEDSENSVEDDDNSEEDDVQQEDSEHDEHVKITPSKALKVVVEAMAAEKKNWPWAETLCIVTETPLPFESPGGRGSKQNPGAPDEILRPSIHDDLQREVAFYDLAVEAVEQARSLCHEAQVPFSRPDDFLAEMVKTDEHMAKVKDRLIFETKKMEAVAQRKSNKEQKLRSKESHANKLAEKAKKKRDHFQAVEAWAESAQANRGRGLADRDDGSSFFQSQSKKRARADQKFGRGGKRGRFKQNDPKALNDMSSFNRRGNFGGIGTKKSASSGGAKSKTGSGANRKGKRARDASRSR